MEAAPKALVGAFSVITNLRMDLRFKLYSTLHNVGRQVAAGGGPTPPQLQ